MTSNLKTQATPRTPEAPAAPTIDRNAEPDHGALEYLEANQQSPGE